MLVIDTNIWVSYALSPIGAVSKNLNKLLKTHDYAFSEETFSELQSVLLRDKFNPFLSQETRRLFLKRLHKNGQCFRNPPPVFDCRDPDDNKFLALAKATKAKYIITGDQDLLVLDPYGKTRIVTLSHF